MLYLNRGIWLWAIMILNKLADYEMYLCAGIGDVLVIIEQKDISCA